MLIDADALVHRAYHALPPLTSPQGELVNAVYGFATTLLKALKDEQPDYVVACYDAGRLTFRNRLYEAYKAQRPESDRDLRQQVPRTKEFVAAMEIPIYTQTGFEADDLIGSLARLAQQQGLRVVIVTGDNDALQLVNEATAVYSLHRGVSETLIYDRQAVKERFGVYPEQVRDYKALAGDASDNIPGVPGIGHKTATALLDKFHDIEGIYTHLSELPERQRRLLQEHRPLMEISRRLASIKTDLAIELDLEQAATDRFNSARAVSFLQKMGFKSLIGRIPQLHHQISTASSNQPEKGQATSLITPLSFQVIRTLEEWQRLLLKLKQQPQLVFDTVTASLNGPLIGLAFAWGADQAAYLPLDPDYPGGLPMTAVKSDLLKLFNSPSIRKIGHHLKDDLAVLRRAGLTVADVWFDTMIAAGLINPQLFGQSLDDLAFAEFGWRSTPTQTLTGQAKKPLMGLVSLERFAQEAGEDVLIIWRLFERYQPQLEEGYLKRIFYQLEMPLVPVLEKMESRGVLLDVHHLAALGDRLRKRLGEIEEAVWQLAGIKFNLNSPTQLKAILFDRLKVSTAGTKKVKTGLSTDAETLARLKTKHPIIPLILEYRELAKLVNTYVETLPKLVDAQGRVHTTFQQLGAATGRLASIHPNLQNIPIRTELGNEVRRAFIATPGYILLGADYSQAELRILAQLSQDALLLEAFHQGGDFHQAVAVRLGVDRRTAKAINFGIIYGLGATALANELGVGLEEARTFIQRYFENFPGVAAYITRMKEKARGDGYVETLFGRRRYLPNINSPSQMLRSSAERMAVNMPAQGSVADLMKLVMVEVDRQLPPDAALLLQIHDELLLEVKTDALTEVAAIVHRVMTSVITLQVPLVVELKSGANWAQLAELKI